ncbi:MAG: HEPN domain-containing protein [Euryarchaeota archaeon]|nr:HEPN domain-containing protein [Euryarchaeota archaeon]
MRPGDTRPWVHKAEEDWRVTRKLDPGTEPDAICFHAQQCAEKYLKALLVRHRRSFPKTHDLRLLPRLALPLVPGLEPLGPDLDTLNPYSTGPRYPGPGAEPDEAREAIQTARRVRASLRRALRVQR